MTYCCHLPKVLLAFVICHCHNYNIQEKVSWKWISGFTVLQVSQSLSKIGTQRQLSYESPQLRVVARIDGQTPIAKLAKVPDLFFWIFVRSREVSVFYRCSPHFTTNIRHNVTTFLSLFSYWPVPPLGIDYIVFSLHLYTVSRSISILSSFLISHHPVSILFFYSIYN